MKIISCNCFMGHKGMDWCSRCDGTGSLVLAAAGGLHRTLPNTKEGYTWALVERARLRAKAARALVRVERWIAEWKETADRVEWTDDERQMLDDILEKIKEERDAQA